MSKCTKRKTDRRFSATINSLFHRLYINHKFIIGAKLWLCVPRTHIYISFRQWLFYLEISQFLLPQIWPNYSTDLRTMDIYLWIAKIRVILMLHTRVQSFAIVIFPVVRNMHIPLNLKLAHRIRQNVFFLFSRSRSQFIFQQIPSNIFNANQ